MATIEATLHFKTGGKKHVPLMQSMQNYAIATCIMDASYTRTENWIKVRFNGNINKIAQLFENLKNQQIRIVF